MFGSSEDTLIEDVFLLDSFVGIRAEAGRTIIRKIHGHPIFTGIHLHRPDGPNDIFRVEKIMFSGGYNYPNWRGISDNYGSAIYITGCENSLFSNIFAVGYKNGFYFRRNQARKFHIQNVDFDSCSNPIFIHGDCEDVYGMISNFSGRGPSGQETLNDKTIFWPLEDTYGIYADGGSNSERKLLCSNLMLTSFGANIVNATGEKTIISLKNINASVWGENPRKTESGEIVEVDKYAFVADQGAKIELDSDLMIERKSDDLCYCADHKGVISKLKSDSVEYGNKKTEEVKETVTTFGGMRRGFLNYR